jgi:hypothetical protein
VGAAIVLVGERLPRRAAIAWWAVTAALVVGRASFNMATQTIELRTPDARTRIVTELAHRHVGVPTELAVHRRELARLEHPVVAPLRDLACTSDADVMVVPPAFWSNLHPATAALLNRIIGADLDSGPALFSLGWRSWVPELHALPLPLAGCDGFVPFSALENPAHYPTYDSILAMLWNGAVSLALPAPAPGRYEIVWELRGTTRDDEPARVRLSTPPAGSSEASLASDWQLLRRAFDVDATTDLTAVRLEFLNDGATPDTDRDVAIGRVWLRPVGDSW